MTQPRRYLGVNDFVEELAAELQSVPLQPNYDSEADLKMAIVEVVKGFTRLRLHPLEFSYDVYALGEEKMTAVSIFGCDYRPDLVIEMGGFPVVALDVRLVAEPEEAPFQVSCALGHALVYCCHYPAVISFIFGKEPGEAYRHLLDHVLEDDIWRKHKIKLIFRERGK